MQKNDWDFRKKIHRHIEARKAACIILGVAEDADTETIKRAYRQAAIKFHPDHNENTEESYRKFTLLKCAYELLAFDKPCEELLKEIESWPVIKTDGKYKLDNEWGHFLWWRDKYFSDGDNTPKAPPDKPSSCI